MGVSLRKPVCNPKKGNLNKAVLEGETRVHRRENKMYLFSRQAEPIIVFQEKDGRCENLLRLHGSWKARACSTDLSWRVNDLIPSGSEGIIPHILGKPFQTQYFLQRNVRKKKHNKLLALVIFKGQKYACIFTNFLYFQILFYKYYSCNGKTQQTCHYGLCLMIMKKIEGQQIVLL